MIRTVRNEFPEFPAALSFIPMLSADDARRQTAGATARPGQGDRGDARTVAEDLNEKYQLPRLFAIEDEYRLAMLEAEHRWVSGILDDLASGELYWDGDTIRAWAEGLQHRMGSFPGIARRPAPTADLPP